MEPTEGPPETPAECATAYRIGERAGVEGDPLGGAATREPRLPTINYEPAVPETEGTVGTPPEGPIEPEGDLGVHFPEVREIEPTAVRVTTGVPYSEKG